MDPLSWGSRLDADHPENRVLIPCLFTPRRQVLAPFATTISKKMCRLFCPDADPAAMSNSAELMTPVLSACECICFASPNATARVGVITNGTTEDMFIHATPQATPLNSGVQFSMTKRVQFRTSADIPIETPKTAGPQWLPWGMRGPGW